MAEYSVEEMIRIFINLAACYSSAAESPVLQIVFSLGLLALIEIVLISGDEMLDILQIEAASLPICSGDPTLILFH